jgi:uncharacterized membrane protein
MAAERISKDIRADMARMSDLLKTIDEDPARFDALIARPAEVLAELGIELEKYASKAVPTEVIAQQVAVAAVQAAQGMMVARIKDVLDLVAVTAHESRSHTWAYTHFSPDTYRVTRADTHVGYLISFDGFTLAKMRDMQLEALVSPQFIQELEVAFENILVEGRTAQQLQAGHG